MTGEPGEITDLLLKWRGGDREAENQLFDLVGPKLRQMAGRFLSRERKGTILQPTAVVNELYLRLQGTKSTGMTGRISSHLPAERCDDT